MKQPKNYEKWRSKLDSFRGYITKTSGRGSVQTGRRVPVWGCCDTVASGGAVRDTANWCVATETGASQRETE